MIKRWVSALCLLAAFAALAWIGPQLVQAQAEEEYEVVLSGLNGPQGVLVDPDGTVWAIDAGLGGDETLEGVDPISGEVSDMAFGETARIVRTTEDGGQEDVATLPSVLFGEEFVGGARLALLDGVLYATNGFWTGHESNRPAAVAGMASIMRIEDGEATEVANLSGIERRMNPDGTIYESHPYGLAAGPDGKLWVTDAGANTLLRVDPDANSVELVTFFPPLPGVFPSPTRGGEMLTDPVPTGITFDEDGTAYISYLSGAPFVPGSTKVVRIQPNNRPADYATGLTMLTDLRTAPNGDMFAVQFAIFTDQGPQFNSGAIVRILPGEDSEVVLGGLSFPTSIDFNEDGDAYIAINGVGPPGSGSVIRVAGLMDAEAIEVEAAEAEEEAEEEAAPTATPMAEEEEEEAEPTATPVAEEEVEEAAVEETATPEAEEEAAEEEVMVAEPIATPVMEEEEVEEAEEVEAVATPVAEEEVEETATPEAEEEAAEEEVMVAEPIATPVMEEEDAAEEMEVAEAEATATPVAEEEAQPEATATPVVEEETADAAPAALPPTGGSGTTLPLAIGMVLLVVAGVALNVWREKRQAA